MTAPDTPARPRPHRPPDSGIASASETEAAEDVASVQESTEVFVRMYRGLLPQHDYKGWLGDCFLIRLQRTGAAAYILIDCGILVGSPDAVARVHAVVEDIRVTTGGKIDLLVVTHEHADHISGFAQASDYFFSDGQTDPEIRVDQLWMAWTENPNDLQASRIKSDFAKRGTALAAVAAMATDNHFGVGAASVMNGLQAFTPAADDALGLVGQKVRTSEVMQKLVGQVAERARFHEPGDVVATPGAVSMRAFVLGPPRNEKMLFKDMPSSGAAKETYLDGPGFNEQLIHQVAAAADGQNEDGPDFSSNSPFSRRYTIIRERDVDPEQQGNLPSSDAIKWLTKTYYPSKGTPDAAINRRRIDGDWMTAAEPLALKLDSDTNNTSLALAFELPDGTVMLFAADAQVGNWLSWHDQNYIADGKTVTAADLLSRARFYKVGHHGSHNATLHEKGLALMTRPDLVAMIPTDEELGARQGRLGWKMPDPNVRTALLQQTRNRVMRNDDLARTAEERLAQSGDRNFAARVKDTDLYIEYKIFGAV